MNILLTSLLLESEPPLLRMCMYCILEHDLRDPIRQAAKQGIHISHGLCLHHYIKNCFEIGKTKDEIKQSINKMRLKNPSATYVPYLKKRPDLVQKYKAGIFDEPLVSS